MSLTTFFPSQEVVQKGCKRLDFAVLSWNTNAMKVHFYRHLSTSYLPQRNICSWKQTGWTFVCEVSSCNQQSVENTIFVSRSSSIHKHFKHQGLHLQTDVQATRSSESHRARWLAPVETRRRRPESFRKHVTHTTTRTAFLSLRTEEQSTPRQKAEVTFKLIQIYKSCVRHFVLKYSHRFLLGSKGSNKILFAWLKHKNEIPRFKFTKPLSVSKTDVNIFGVNIFKL